MLTTPVFILTKTRDGDRIFGLDDKKDRARWGASGALSPTIRYSGVESLAEAALCLASFPVSGDEGQGPVQRTLCELRQDREVAAVAIEFLVLQVSLA